MKRVLQFILKDYKVKVLLFGGGREEILKLREFENCLASNSVMNVAGKINLKMELEIISMLDIMISMDSSNMHMASLMGTPVVSIWGVTHPYAGFYGFGQHPDNAVQVDLPYRPCFYIFGKEDYPDKNPNLPMDLIQEEWIVQKVKKYLS